MISQAVRGGDYDDATAQLRAGDALTITKTLESKSVDCVITSVPAFRARPAGEVGQWRVRHDVPARRARQIVRQLTSAGYRVDPGGVIASDVRPGPAGAGELVPADLAQSARLEDYLGYLRAMFREVRRVLADDGTAWVHIPDAYATVSVPVGETAISARNLIGVPWRMALAMQEDGWVLRNAVVWNKDNDPDGRSGGSDRLGSCYDHLFFFSKHQRYWSGFDESHSDDDHDVLRPQVQNVAGGGDVWTMKPDAAKSAGATLPQSLIERCIADGCKVLRADTTAAVVYDPFSGSGSVGAAAQRMSRRYVGVDIDPKILRSSLHSELSEPPLDLRF